MEVTILLEILVVVKYKLSAFFLMLCDLCMSAHTLSLLSCVYSLRLGLDWENKLDQRERERMSCRASGKKSGRLILNDTQNF